MDNRGTEQQLTKKIEALEDELRKCQQERLEQQEIAAKIQQAQKLESLGLLAGGIAHDFNNLLAAIMGNTSVMMMDLPAESPLQACLRDITTTAKRATELTRQMLAYAGKSCIQTSTVDINCLVQEMTQLLEVSITKKAVLVYNFSEHLLPIRGDSAQLQQIIVNLIINASEALHDESGTIAINTGIVDCDRQYLKNSYVDDNLKTGAYSYIEVTDTGTGMNGDTVKKIFDPFFSTKFTGRGLGLAAVLGIVRGHNGAIRVSSTPKKGTQIRVMFPACKEPLHISQQLPSPVEENWRSNGTVLLVDDEESVRKSSRRMLRRIGIRVLIARDGREALEIFRTEPNRVDCVLLDLTMPKMDGKECFKELRRIRPNVPIVLTSGYNEQQLSNLFPEKGLSGFIQKPYSTQELAAKLKAVLD